MTKVNEGDVLTDMHDIGKWITDRTGCPVFTDYHERSWVVLSHHTMRVDGASEICSWVLDGEPYTNKQLVVYKIESPGIVYAVYAYDDRVLGTIRLTRR